MDTRHKKLLAEQAEHRFRRLSAELAVSVKQEVGSTWRIDFLVALVEARLAKHMTQSDLAEMIGTSQAAIAQIESGKANPTFKTLAKIADVLSVQIKIS
jgi:DNA-binding XRE family transcriptional regulator